MKQQISLRISNLTKTQIDDLGQSTGMNQTEIVSVAIDRMFREETMKYTVTVNKNGIEISSIPDCSQREARKVARDEAKSNPNAQIFVEWFRSSDGQHGYLNPDGNHAITGQAW